MSIPVITVIQNKNYGWSLEETIKSSLNQKVKFDEVIGTDAGSTDNSIDIYKKYLGNYLLIEKNQAGVLNEVLVTLIKKYNDFFFCWINSDDKYLSNFVETHLNFFNNNPTVDMVCSNAYYKRYNNDNKELYINTSWEGLESGVNRICQPTVMIRSNVFNKIGLFDENIKYAFDFEYWLRAKLNKIVLRCISDITILYTLHTGSLSNKYKKEIKEELDNIIKNRLSL